jgi:hypothetical protein
MSGLRTAAVALGLAGALASGVFVHAGQGQGQGQLPSQFPLSIGLRERGSSVSGAFEGWYHNKDGSVSALVGYINRNTKQELDIPVGLNNRIDPGGPDQGQPTHFLAGRQWGVFTVKLPKDFGDKKLTWTLVVNGFTNTITLHTKPTYILEPYEDAASKNTPPVIRFEPNGSAFTGPPVGTAAILTATVGEGLALTTWATDEGPKINVPAPPPARGATAGAPAAPAPSAAPMLKWSLFRGPAAVKFDPFNPKVDKESGGKNTTTAIFSAPGEYILRLQANDSSGEGGAGFQCCWTNAHVEVKVKPSTTPTAAARVAPAPSAPAVASVRSSIAPTGMVRFIGAWTLGVDTPQGALSMTLTLKDQGGKLVGEIAADMAPEPQAVTDITNDGDSLVLKYALNVQGQSIPAQITILPAGEKWKASFDFANGQFVMDGTAAKK